jgi:hypothetical protein
MAVDGENGEDAMLVKEVMSTKIEAVAPTATARERCTSWASAYFRCGRMESLLVW